MTLGESKLFFGRVQDWDCTGFVQPKDLCCLGLFTLGYKVTIFLLNASLISYTCLASAGKGQCCILITVPVQLTQKWRIYQSLRPFLASSSSCRGVASWESLCVDEWVGNILVSKFLSLQIPALWAFVQFTSLSTSGVTQFTYLFKCCSYAYHQVTSNNKLLLLQ